jgi:hypothetical protein
MRLSIVSGAALLAGATLALVACGGHGVVPSSAGAPMSASNVTSQGAFGDAISPLATCAKSPPQYDWIFKGSCQSFDLKSSGGSFKLATYADYTLAGSIGDNTAKGTVTVALAVATGKNGDIESDKGKSFPYYKAKGTTILYASANNQSLQTIKAISHIDKTILKYVITASKSFPGNTCAAAYLGEKNGKVEWTTFPDNYPVKGKTVSVDVYEAPTGFELKPKGTALYIAVNCF